MDINAVITKLGVPSGAEVEVAIVLVKFFCLAMLIGIWNFFKIAFFRKG